MNHKNTLSTHINVNKSREYELVAGYLWEMFSCYWVAELEDALVINVLFVYGFLFQTDIK